MGKTDASRKLHGKEKKHTLSPPISNLYYPQNPAHPIRTLMEVSTPSPPRLRIGNGSLRRLATSVGVRIRLRILLDRRHLTGRDSDDVGLVQSRAADTFFRVHPRRLGDEADADFLGDAVEAGKNVLAHLVVVSVLAAGTRHQSTDRVCAEARFGGAGFLGAAGFRAVAVLVGRAVERAQVEDAAEERVDKGQIGDEHGGRGLARVPEGPRTAERVREGVVFVQGGGDDDEDSEREDSTQGELLARWHLRAYEHGKGDGEQDQVLGDVEDGVGDEMVDCGVALDVGSGDCPVHVQWPAPHAQVQDLHDDKGNSSVDAQGLNPLVLSASSGETHVHDENACLGEPDGETLALFDYQNHLGAVCSVADILRS